MPLDTGHEPTIRRCLYDPPAAPASKATGLLITSSILPPSVTFR